MKWVTLLPTRPLRLLLMAIPLGSIIMQINSGVYNKPYHQGESIAIRSERE
jgi:hypothetical protein